MTYCVAPICRPLTMATSGSPRMARIQSLWYVGWSIPRTRSLKAWYERRTSGRASGGTWASGRPWGGLGPRGGRAAGLRGRALHVHPGETLTDVLDARRESVREVRGRLALEVEVAQEGVVRRGPEAGPAREAF